MLPSKRHTQRPQHFPTERQCGPWTSEFCILSYIGSKVKKAEGDQECKFYLPKGTHRKEGALRCTRALLDFRMAYVLDITREEFDTSSVSNAFFCSDHEDTWASIFTVRKWQRCWWQLQRWQTALQSAPLCLLNNRRPPESLLMDTLTPDQISPLNMKTPL